ncbi:NUDIX hydrolase [Alistipes sp.]|uniref:NUDIX hydrolase n=1 Tax=Alistipes sp. TaxID=1872444 RepID=UPI003AF1CCE9
MKNPENRKWTVLASEYLARKPWFTVRHETIALPDGRCIPDYYVFEYPDWVNVITITREGRFVMIDQYRHGLGETSYELPAGVMEPADSSPLAAAQRELEEETGYGGGQWRLVTTLSPNPATQNNLTHCFLAEGVERISAQHLDATEDLRVHLFTREEVVELLRTDRIRQALMAAPLWRYLAEEAGADR